MEIPDAINQEQASHIIDRLGEENFITPREAKLMTGAIRNTLALVPQEVRHLVRASMLKSMVYEIIRFDQLIEEIVTAENTSKE
ncbi:MAG: hypothetical protein FWF06_08150 [Symbiobacteriaceae bacterium]|nr:hypothetical protein [Symbiobacteriaceae bacterium]